MWVKERSNAPRWPRFVLLKQGHPQDPWRTLAEEIPVNSSSSSSESSAAPRKKDESYEDSVECTLSCLQTPCLYSRVSFKFTFSKISWLAPFCPQQNWPLFFCAQLLLVKLLSEHLKLPPSAICFHVCLLLDSKLHEDKDFVWFSCHCFPQSFSKFPIALLQAAEHNEHLEQKPSISVTCHNFLLKIQVALAG